MKKKEIWLLGILISVVLAVEGWSILKVTRSQVAGHKSQVTSHKSQVIRAQGHKDIKTQRHKHTRIQGHKVTVNQIQRLELELLGTAIGNTKDPIAFIKDLKTDKQGVYRVGSIIRGLRIIKIGKGEAILEKEAQKYVLRLSSRGRVWSKITQDSSPIVVASDGQIVVRKQGLLNEVSELYRTLSAVKVRPYSQSGEVLGLMVDGIPQGSIIEEAGIRNKDVIKTINDQKISSYQKALQVFRKVRNQKEIRMSLLRDGQIKRLCYRIDN